MIYIYWDGDDCLFKTHQQFINILKTKHNYRPVLDAYLTPANTDGYLADILDTAEFMRSTPLDSVAVMQFEYIRDMFKGTQHGLATHRGYHVNGDIYTKELLNSAGLTFDSEHYIDPEWHRDKMGYLRSLHNPEDIIILIDDNTSYDHTTYPNTFTVLLDKPWNQHVVTAYPDLRIHPHQIFECINWLFISHELYEVARYGRATECETVG